MIGRLLQAALALGASDIHLRAGEPAFVRVDGLLSKTNGSPIAAETIEEIIANSGRARVERCDGSWEYSGEVEGVARYRGHAFRQSGRWALALRIIPNKIPSFAELRLPPVVKSLSEWGPGLVPVTGPTGSGKSTTAASILQYLVNRETVHLITLEDPVEYRFAGGSSCVSQREIGRDIGSAQEGLRSLLREDPDVVFISEIRDLAGLDTALQAAEAGHSVYTTFHTASGLKTIQRMIAMFPQDEQTAVRARLADTLRGVLCQRLLPRKGGRGRVLCVEVLINNYSVKECIRDPARTATLQATLERSQDQQMQTFDHCLAGLVRDGLVALEVAMAQAHAPADFRRLMSFPGLVS